MVLEFKVAEGSDGAGQSSKSRGASGSVQPAAQPADSSATSTGSKRQRHLSADDNASNKIPKTDSNPKRIERKIERQLASYALESFFNGRYRSHAVHGMVQGPKLGLWYYDRVGVVKSHSVNFVEKPVQLVHFLMSIADITDADWGFHPAIKYSAPSPTPGRDISTRNTNPSKSNDRSDTPSDDDGKEHSARDSDYIDPSARQRKSIDPPIDSAFIGATITVGGQPFTLGSCVFRQYALTGRGTCVILADNDTTVVKLSWPDKDRTAENEFLEKAYKSANEYENGKYSSMTEHLPVLLKSQDFDTSALPRSRMGCRASPQESESPLAPSRILRVTVYKKLVPMTEIRTAGDLKTVMRDVARCRRFPSTV
jgi:hypothetical protein